MSKAQDQTAAMYYDTSGIVMMPSASGPRPANLLFRTVHGPKVNGKEDLKVVVYYSDYGFSGAVIVGGRLIHAWLEDTACTGDPRLESDDPLLCLDLFNTGKLDPRCRIRGTQPIKIDGHWYSMPNLTSEGAFDLVPVDDPELPPSPSSVGADKIVPKGSGPDLLTAAGQTWTNSLSMKLAYIPAGESLMGSPPDEQYRDQWSEIRHKVVIPKPFLIGTTTVTQGQWKAIIGTQPDRQQGDGVPVRNVSWTAANEFCRRLSKQEGRIYVLPTEAQWEYACRAGSTGPYAGTGKLDEMGWYAVNSGDRPFAWKPEFRLVSYLQYGQRAHPVGMKPPNAWGLYDMHGNVSQWCRDIFLTNNSLNTLDSTDPDAGLIQSDELRSVRGGNYGSPPFDCRCAARSGTSQDTRADSLGFRVCMLHTENLTVWNDKLAGLSTPRAKSPQPGK